LISNKTNKGKTKTNSKDNNDDKFKDKTYGKNPEFKNMKPKFEESKKTLKFDVNTHTFVEEKPKNSKKRTNNMNRTVRDSDQKSNTTSSDNVLTMQYIRSFL